LVLCRVERDAAGPQVDHHVGRIALLGHHWVDERSSLATEGVNGVGEIVGEVEGPGLSAVRRAAEDGVQTGGIAHNKRLTDFIAAHVDFIAPVFVYPGENELEALARNALAVLRGDCEAKTYYKADVTA